VEAAVERDRPLTATFVSGVLTDCTLRQGRTLRRHAGRALFDFAACARAGHGVVAELRTSDDAARAAAAGHALDRDDLHWPSVTHPGSIVWPVVLAVSTEAGADDRTRLLAAAAGYETTTRLALALGARHRTYWHATSTAGTVGAAVAAAVACGLGEDGATVAAGHAISVAGGSIQCVLERSRTVVFHRAHAAATGIAAAAAAAAGLGATRAGLEAEHGLFAATAPGQDPTAVLARRERLALEELTFRFYASTGFAHAAIDAALELAPVEPGRVGEIEIQVPRSAAAIAGNVDPRDREEAWWSVPYAVATSLLGRSLEDGPPVDDDAIRTLLRKTRVVPRDDPSSTVTVDGRSATRRDHRGHHDRPLSDEDLVAKWRILNPEDDPPLHLLDPAGPLTLR
jgi:2-methylcitrate dehydratase PrpD